MFKPDQPIVLSDIKNSSFVNDVYKVCPDYDDYDVLEERVFYERNPREFKQGCSDGFDNPFEWEVKDLQRDLDSRLVDDLDHLDDGRLCVDRSTDSFAVKISEFRAIQSLLLDAYIRYGYTDNELLHFLFGVLGVAERYGLNLIADDPF